MPKQNYIYILQCADGTLYTGWTSDLNSRITAHNKGVGAKYTKPRLPVILVHSEVFESNSEALKRELEIKKLNRRQKLELIKTATFNKIKAEK